MYKYSFHTYNCYIQYWTIINFFLNSTIFNLIMMKFKQHSYFKY